MPKKDENYVHYINLDDRRCASYIVYPHEQLLSSITKLFDNRGVQLIALSRTQLNNQYHYQITFLAFTKSDKNDINIWTVNYNKNKLEAILIDPNKNGKIKEIVEFISYCVKDALEAALTTNALPILLPPMCTVTDTKNFIIM